MTRISNFCAAILAVASACGTAIKDAARIIFEFFAAGTNAAVGFLPTIRRMKSATAFLAVAVAIPLMSACGSSSSEFRQRRPHPTHSAGRPTHSAGRPTHSAGRPTHSAGRHTGRNNRSGGGRPYQCRRRHHATGGQQHRSRLHNCGWNRRRFDLSGGQRTHTHR